MKRLALVLLPALTIAAPDPVGIFDMTFLVESADAVGGRVPVEGAELRWLCPPPESWRVGPYHDDEGSFAAVSDANGIARLQGVATNWPHSSALFSSERRLPLVSGDPRLPGVRFPALRVSRDGFYTRLTPMDLGPPDESGVWTVASADGPGRGVDGECLLRPVRRPHPMRVSSFAAGSDFPEEPVGYDAARGAFLPPLGDGETADFFVESGRTPGPWPCASYSWIVIRPAGPNGALALVPSFPDELRTPDEVPDPATPGSGVPFLWRGVPLRFLHPIRWGDPGAVFGTGCTAPALAHETWDRCIPSAATEDEGAGFAARNAVVFRSRVRPAADGGAAAARYGAIVPCDIGGEFLCPARFLVRFNEEDGERGLEPADLGVPGPAALAVAAAPAGERLVEGPWAYRLLDGGRGATLAGFAAIPETPGGSLVLPAELGGRPVVGIEPGAFSTLRFDGSETSRFFDRRDAARWWRTNAVELVVPEGVRRIGARAFAGFAPARALSLPSTLEALGRECFADCIRLESVALPPSVAAVPAAAFQGCLALRSASAPGARTVAPLAFAQCPDLDAVRLAPDAGIDPWAFRDSPSARIVSHAESSEDEPHAEFAEAEPHAERAIPDWTEYFMAMDAFVEPDCVNDTNVWSEAFFTDFDAFRDALLAALRDRDGEAFAGLVDERHRAGIRGPDGRCDVFDKAYFRRVEPAGRSDVLLRRIGPDDRTRLLAAMPDETNRVGRMFVCIVSRPGGNGPALSLPVLYDRGSFRIASPRGWIRFGEAVPDIVPPGTVFEDGSRVAKADAYPVWVPRFRSPVADALAEALSEALRGDPPPDFAFRWHPLARGRAAAANAGLAAFRDALAGRELRVRFNAWTPETDPLAGSGLGSSALAEHIGSLQLDAGGFASGSDRRDEQRRRRASRSGNWPGLFPSVLEDGLWLEGDVAVVNGGRETPFLLFTAVEQPDGCRLLGMQPMDELLADVSAAAATPTVERVARAFLDSLATNATLSRIEAESADFYVPVRPNLRIALERELLPATRSAQDEPHAEAAEFAE